MRSIVSMRVHCRGEYPEDVSNIMSIKAAAAVVYIAIALLACGNAQAGWSKYNAALKRTEHFDNSGRRTSWEKYNKALKRTEYFDRQGKRIPGRVGGR